MRLFLLRRCTAPNILRALLGLAALGCLLSAAPVHGYRVVARYPHSTESYTEGFFYKDGLFYEGTGLNGHSALIVTTPETGKPVQMIHLPEQYFGEGIVDWGPYLLEWTWKEGKCFVYDRFSLQQVKVFTYTGEGWGMTRNGKEIITSDGTDRLSFRDPKTFAVTRTIEVTDGKDKVTQLNELEYVKGAIYANVWHSDRIAHISPSDGHVIDWVDLSGILPDRDKVNDESVLNGIAYDSEHDRLFVTGKQWPFVFEIKVTK